jgi:hypothetical protein
VTKIGDCPIVSFRESATEHIYVSLNFTSGEVGVYKGVDNSVLGVYSAALTVNTWYCVEIAGTIHDSTGTVTVKLNGNEILTLSSKDTRNGGAGVCNNVRIMHQYLSVLTYGDMYFDDVAFRDDQLPGQYGVYLAYVNAEATSGIKQWEASASTPDVCVSEIPATFTNYIYRANDELDDQHEFEHVGIPNLNYESIAGVGVIALAKLASAGSGSAKVTYYDPANAGGEESAALALDTSGMYVEGYFLDDYNGDAFTRTSINQLYIGVRVGAVP